MRIAIFSNTYRPAINGVVTSIVHFKQGLVASGNEVHIIAPQYEGEQTVAEPYVFRFPAIDLSGSLNAAFPIPVKAFTNPTIYGLHPEIIHSQHPVLMGDLAADYAEELGVPLVFTFHTRYDEYAEQYAPVAKELSVQLVETLLLRYLKRCNHIIAPTESIRKMILDYDIEVPITVIPTPIDLSRYREIDAHRVRQELGLQSCEVLLYIGRVSGEKNLAFLLSAFERIHAQREQSRLLIVGSGPGEQDLRQQAQERGLGEAVIFTGSVPYEEIPEYASAADVFVFPSTSETQGLVLIEAMAAGTPVVAVEAPGQNDILVRGGGLLVAEDEEEFSGAVISLLSDPEKRQKMSKQALQIAQAYDIPSTVSQLVEVYRQARQATQESQPETSLRGETTHA